MQSAPPDFSASFTTVAAYQNNNARAIAGHLHEKFGLPDDRREHIATCLQEAWSNALVHGNMEIDSHPLTPDGFNAYYNEIRSRLLRNPYRKRLIVINAWHNEDSLILSVSDEGRGFSMENTHVEKDYAQRRGLFLIRSLVDHVWVGDDRRTLFMTFNYPK